MFLYICVSVVYNALVNDRSQISNPDTNVVSLTWDQSTGSFQLGGQSLARMHEM